LAQDTDHVLLVRYLLGELPRYQHKQVEQKFFSDDTFFDRLLEVEEGLINDYVTGRLTQQERLKFERNFLNTPQRREKVDLYRNNQQSGAATNIFLPESKSTASRTIEATSVTTSNTRWVVIKEFFQGWRLAWQIAAACVGVALLIGLWIYLSNRKNADGLASNPGAPATFPTPSNPASTPEPTPSAVNDKSGGQANESIPQPGRPNNTTNTVLPPGKKQTNSANESPGYRETAPVFATLTPGLLRDNAQVPAIDLSSGTRSLVLKVELHEERYDSYRAVLMKREQGGGEDRQVYSWPKGSIRGENAGASLNLQLPTGRLTVGFYYLELYGSSADGEKKIDRYPFEILKR
jgi:hypothetical protein